MKSYLDLVKEYGRVHKKKNRITVLCIAIAVCLVTAIFGMADMEVRAQIIGQINTNGNWHMSIKDIDYDTAKLIGNRVDVADSGWIQSIGGNSGYKINEKILCVVGSDKKIAAEMGVKVIKGSYPEKSDECLLDQRALEQFGLSIGSKASVIFPNGSLHQFTVVGTYSDFASLKTGDAHGLILSYDSLKQLMSTEGSRYYVKFKNKINMRRAIDEIKKDYKLSDNQVSENTYLLGAIGQSRDNYMLQLYMTAAVLGVLVLAAGVLMIASSFNMSVMERIKFFGLLRCLGASKAQVKKFVLFEGIRFSLKGVPIGLLSGTIITWASCVYLKYVNPAYFSDMPLFGVSPISLLGGTAVGFLTVILASLSPSRKASKVSPLSAVNGDINQASVPQSNAAVKTKYGHVEIVMGIHHAFAGKKNIMLMVGSFAVSIVLFLSFSVIINFMHQAVKPLRPYTPDISLISSDNTLSLDTKLFQKIKDIPEVKHAYGRMFAYDVFVTNTKGSGKINLISYEENQFNWAKKQLVKGNIKEVENGLDNVLIVYTKDLKWNVGDIITLRLSAGEKKVKIAGMLSSSPFDGTEGTQTLICAENTFQKLTDAQGYTIIDVQLRNSANDKAVSQIRGLTTSKMKFSDRRQSNDEVKAAFYSFAIFSYGFLAIIASITMFNIINSMNISVSTRMNQYGVMRAVGMSGKQLQRMVFSEAVTYSVCGCVAGCILGVPLHRYLFKQIITSRWGLLWHLPVYAIFVIVIIVLFTTIISVIEPVKKVNRIDIVNVVNAQ